VALLLAGLGQAQAVAQPAARSTAPAATQPDAGCAAIAEAMRVLGAADQFHTRLVARMPGRRRPVEEERFVLGDVVYANSPASGRWVKLPMTAAERQALGAGLVAYPPRDCQDEGMADLDGVAARVYSFRQILPGQGGEGPSEAPGRLWVAGLDGRPRRYEGRHGEVQVTLTIDYEGVTPPFGR
jgi:hypothetical protein